MLRGFCVASVMILLAGCASVPLPRPQVQPPHVVHHKAPAVQPAAAPVAVPAPAPSPTPKPTLKQRFGKFVCGDKPCKLKWTHH